MQCLKLKDMTMTFFINLLNDIIMNKIFTKKQLVVMMLLMVSMTINAQTKKEVFENSASFRMTPSDYSTDKKSSLYLLKYDDAGDFSSFQLYDSNFNKGKTITVTETPVSYYTIYQEREHAPVVDKGNSQEYKQSTWDPGTSQEVDVFTPESAENYVKGQWGEYRDKNETSAAIFFYPNGEYNYYGYYEYGYQYPRMFYKYDKSTSFLYSCQYDYVMSYTDTWKAPTREDYSTTPKPLSTRKLSDVDTKTFYLSQTLFNEDNAYEYVLPILTPVDFENESMDWDEAKQQEVVANKTSGTYLRTTGYRIVNESGATVNTISFDNNFEPYGFDIIDLDGNIYLAVDGQLTKSATETVSAIVVYTVDPQTNSVRQISMEEGMHISPTMPRRSEMITITLEGNSKQPRQVNIVNATGKTVKRIVVPAGQRRIQVNAGELSPGLNIVNVSGQKTQACKIIVR